MSAEAFSLEVEQRIKAWPAEVFRYLTESDRYSRWMGTAAEIDARPGGAFRVELPGGSAVVGEYIVVDPPGLLVYTWGWENDELVPPGSSTVEITLHPDGDETILVLRHAALPTDPAAASHRAGWDRYLARLATAASGEDPGPDASMGGGDTG